MNEGVAGEETGCGEVPDLVISSRIGKRLIPGELVVLAELDTAGIDKDRIDTGVCVSEVVKLLDLATSCKLAPVECSGLGIDLDGRHDALGDVKSEGRSSLSQFAGEVVGVPETSVTDLVLDSLDEGFSGRCIDRFCELRDKLGLVGCLASLGD